jgi:hypothetical protein
MGDDQMNAIILLKKCGLYFPLICLLVCSYLVLPAKYVAAAATGVYISPATKTIGNGASFTVDLKLNTTTAFLGWQSDIQYDASKLQCTGVTMGTWLANWISAHGGLVWSPGSPVINNSNGSITNLAQGGLNTSNGLTGDGVLCTLTFTTNSNADAITVVTPLNISITNTAGLDISGIQINGGTLFVGTIPPPAVTSFSPTAQSRGGTVVINGSNFTGATSVNFGAAPAQSFTVNSAVQITAVVGNGTSGSVSVNTLGGTGSLSGFVFLSAPVISSFTPTSAAGSQAVIINGAGFTGASSVSFGGVPAASFIVNSSSRITATVAAESASGVVSITNSYGAGTLPGFTFIPPPVVSSFSPISGCAGTIVTISGSGFTGTAALSFGGIPAQSFTVNSNTQITAAVGTGSTGVVAVTTAGGSTSSANSFTFVPPPSISSFSPATGGNGTSIIINGTNLGTTTAVSFGGTAAQSFTIADTQITATVGTGSNGSVVVVTNGGAASQPGFVFIPAPVIYSFSPSAGATGTVVTINGNNFTGANAVNFGGVPAATFTVNNATTITATLGSGFAGAVSVTTPGGTATQNGFTFYPVPTISGFTPASGTTGTVITITGTGFAGTSNVTFGGISASSFTVISSTQITATVGGRLTGTVGVTTPGGNATLGGFSFISPSATVGFFPATTTIINGSSFSVDFVVNSSSGLLSWQSDFTFDATKFQCTGIEEGDFLFYYALNNGGVTIPIANPIIDNLNGVIHNVGYTVLGVGLGGRSGSGTLCVLHFVANSSTNGTGVITPTGLALNDVNGNPLPNVATQSCSVTVNWPFPVINSFSPNPAGRGDTVTIIGSNFGSTSAVTFGGIAAQSFIVISDTQITGILGNGATGMINITAPGGTAVKPGFSFVPVWDVNRDRIGNVLDVVKIGLVWNTRGSPGWIPEDINADGIVNILDIVALGLHWNETW